MNKEVKAVMDAIEQLTPEQQSQVSLFCKQVAALAMLYDPLVAPLGLAWLGVTLAQAIDEQEQRNAVGWN